MASTKPNHLPKAPSPNTITLGVGLQHVGLEATFHPQHSLVGRQAPRMLEETMWEAARKAAIPVFKHKSEQTRPSSAKSHLSSRPAFLISWSGVWRVGEDDQVRNPRPEQTLLLPSEGLLLSRKTSFMSLLPPKLHSPELKFRSAGRESVFDLERSTYSLCNMGSTQALASAELRGQHPPPGSVETAPKCKTDEAFKEKVIYIVESFRASRNLRFITWGTKPMILQSSHREGADVFYGK